MKIKKLENKISLMNFLEQEFLELFIELEAGMLAGLAS
jgi:hypothetical protein